MESGAAAGDVSSTVAAAVEKLQSVRPGDRAWASGLRSPSHTTPGMRSRAPGLTTAPSGRRTAIAPATVAPDVGTWSGVRAGRLSELAGRWVRTGTESVAAGGRADTWRDDDVAATSAGEWHSPAGSLESREGPRRPLREGALHAPGGELADRWVASSALHAPPPPQERRVESPAGSQVSAGPSYSVAPTQVSRRLDDFPKMTGEWWVDRR